MVDNINGTIRLPKYPTTYIYGLSLHGASTKNATVSVRGNGMVLGLWNNHGAANRAYFGMTTADYNRCFYNYNAYGKQVNGNTVVSAGAWVVGNDYPIGVTKDASKSGLTGSVSISIPGNSYVSMPCTYFIYST